MLENSMLNYSEKVYRCPKCEGTGSYSADRLQWESDVYEGLLKIADNDKTAKSFIAVIDIFEEEKDEVSERQAYDRAGAFMKSRNINFNLCPECDGAGEIYSIRG